MKVVLSVEASNFLRSSCDAKAVECICNRCTKNPKIEIPLIFTFYLNDKSYTECPHIENTYEVEQCNYWVRNKEYGTR